MATDVAMAVTCFAGLGSLVQGTLWSLGARNVTISRIRDYDLLRFRFNRPELAQLRSLHVAEDIFVELARMKAIRKPADIRRLCTSVDRAGVLDAIV